MNHFSPPFSYFEYMSKAFFHKLPTVLCKIVGVYQIGYHNKITGKRQMDQVTKYTLHRFRPFGLKAGVATTPPWLVLTHIDFRGQFGRALCCS